MILTYLGMLFIPLAVGLIILNVTSAGILERLEQSNATIAERHAVTVENQLRQVNLLAYELSNNPTVKSIAARNDISAYDRIDIFSFLNDSASLIAQYPAVKDFYISFNSQNVVLTSTGTHSKYWYYNDNVKGSGADYDEWLETLNRRYVSPQYLPRDNGLVSAQESEKYLVCVRTVSTGWNFADATIVIKISRDYLRDNCLTSNYTAEGVASLYYNTGELIASGAGNFSGGGNACFL